MCCGSKRRANKAQMAANLVAMAQSHANQQRTVMGSSSEPPRSLPAPAAYMPIETSRNVPKQDNEKSGEMLAMAGVHPPSYDIAINRAVVPPEPNPKDIDNGTSRFPRPINATADERDLSDDEEFFEMVNGDRIPNRDLQAASNSFVANYGSQTQVNSGQDLAVQLFDIMRMPKRERRALWREAKHRHKSWKRGGCGAGGCSPCSTGCYTSCAAYAPRSRCGGRAYC